MDQNRYRETVVEASAMRRFVRHLYLVRGKISLFDAYQELKIEPPLLAKTVADLESAGVLQFVDGEVMLCENWRIKLIGRRKLLALKRQRGMLDWIPESYRVKNFPAELRVLPKEWRLSKLEQVLIE